MQPRIVVGGVGQVLLLVACGAGVGLAQGPPSSETKADTKFAGLLAEAKKAPDKADWKALRQAYSETTGYNPYNIKWKDELKAAGDLFNRGDAKAAEDAILKLIDREGSMRLDAHGLAAVMYKERGDKEKEDFHRKCIEGIAGTLFVAGTGLSYEKPIEVLFIEEEYLFLQTLGVKSKRQALSIHDGHRFDVFEIMPKEGEEAKTFYFNVDLPQKALAKMVGRMKLKTKDK